jgi:hypothetical protein
MGKIINLYCAETPGLKLGTGSASTINEVPAGDVIVFRDGYAVFDADEFPDWERWVAAPGTPTIRILDEAEATSAVGAVECPTCGRSFKSEFGLNSHLRTHAPKAPTTTNPRAAKAKAATPATS